MTIPKTPGLLAFLIILLAGPSRADAVISIDFPGDSTPIPDERRLELEESHARWIEARARSGGNYRYQVNFSSFSGFRSTTTIEVTRGMVSKRTYEEFIPSFFNFEPRNYVEEVTEIGSNSFGAPALTVDRLYEIARAVLEGRLNPNEQLVLTFDDLGLLMNCFTYDTRIADDVPTNGVRIVNLTLLPRFPGASDASSAEDHSRQTAIARPNRKPLLRAEIKRLKFALRDTKRIRDLRRKREAIRRIRNLIRKRSRALG